MTAFYTGRAFFMTFWGPEKLPSPDDPEAPASAPASDAAAHGHSAIQRTPHADGDAHGHDSGGHVGHESPPIMTYPLIALAGCTVLIGLICLLAGPFAGTTEWFAHHLHATFGFESLGHVEHHFDWATAIVGTLAGAGWNRAELHALRRATSRCSITICRAGSRPLYEASLNKFYVDEFYEWLVVRPTRAFAIDLRFRRRLFRGWAGEGHRQDSPRVRPQRCWPGIRTG